MTYLETSKVINRVILEVAGTIATNGIQELSHEDRGGVSTFSYVVVCLKSTAYNAVRAMDGFNMSYSEFCDRVDTAVRVSSPEYIKAMRSVARSDRSTRKAVR